MRARVFSSSGRGTGSLGLPVSHPRPSRRHYVNLDCIYRILKQTHEERLLLGQTDVPLGTEELETRVSVSGSASPSPSSRISTLSLSLSFACAHCSNCTRPGAPLNLSRPDGAEREETKFCNLREKSSRVKLLEIICYIRGIILEEEIDGGFK